MPISIRKQIIFAVKWVVKLLKDKYRILSVSNVSSLFIDAIKNKGVAVDKKEKIQINNTKFNFHQSSSASLSLK